MCFFVIADFNLHITGQYNPSCNPTNRVLSNCSVFFEENLQISKNFMKNGSMLWNW